ANNFYVRNQFLCAIALEFGMGSRATGTALVEQYDTIDFGIEEATIIFAAAGARSTMNKKHRDPFGISRFIHIQLMRWFNGDLMALVRFNPGVKRLHRGSCLFVLQYAWATSVNTSDGCQRCADPSLA